jgi:RNA polymerase sigma-70 factor (ECF subfamily)
VSTELDQAAADFQTVRPRLFGIAYRMLGSATEAEDVVQDAWLRWQGTDRADVREPIAFLSTVTTRLALNAATSARARREQYTGPWVPEPVSTLDDPALGAERAEALDIAMLMLMERLDPLERAVYVLREAFEYPYAQIAEVLEISEANARQLGHRAKGHLAERTGRPAPKAEQRRLLESFLQAAKAGDIAQLEQLLAEDVVAYADGGGVVTASPRPIEGRERVAKFLGAGAKFLGDAQFELVELNGSPAMLITLEGEAPSLFFVDARDDRIQRLLVQRNPAKLGALSRIGGASGPTG